MDKVGFVHFVCASGGYLWDRNREEAIMGSWLRYFGTGKKEQKAPSISREMGRTLIFQAQ